MELEATRAVWLPRCPSVGSAVSLSDLALADRRARGCAALPPKVPPQPGSPVSEKEPTGEAAAASPPPGAGREGAPAREGGTQRGEGAGRGAPWDRGGPALSRPPPAASSHKRVGYRPRSLPGLFPPPPWGLGQSHCRRSDLCPRWKRREEKDAHRPSLRAPLDEATRVIRLSYFCSSTWEKH